MRNQKDSNKVKNCFKTEDIAMRKEQFNKRWLDIIARAEHRERK